MNYEEMSDFEINKAVSRFVDFGDTVVTHNDDNETIYLCEKDGLWDMIPVGSFDPCSNPSEAWPIIIANNIGINHGKVFVNDEWVNMWLVGTGTPEAQERTTDSSKVLRAAMICFLKMKDVENE